MYLDLNQKDELRSMRAHDEMYLSYCTQIKKEAGEMTLAYDVIPYSQEALVGILLHSTLASSRMNRYAIHEEKIYVGRSKRIQFDEQKVNPIDILKNDVMLQLIDASPKSLSVYDSSGVFVGFETAFQGYTSSSKEYTEYIERQCRKYRGVQESELALIKKRRIKIYKEKIHEIIELVDKNNKEIYNKLERSFVIPILGK